MATTISLGVQKGGSSKTTTAGIVAHLFSQNERVLAVDMDCQGNLTEMLTNIAADEFHQRTVLEAIEGNNVEPYIHHVSDNLHVLPSNNLVAMLPRYLYRTYGFEDLGIYRVLKTVLTPVQEMYDWIVIDTPPALGEATMNALVASDFVVAMFESSQWCYSAIPNFLQTVDLARRLNPQLEIAGILRTLNDVRRSDAKAFNDLIAEEYPDKVFETVIRRKAAAGRLAISGFNPNENKELDDALDQYKTFFKELRSRVTSRLDRPY